MHRASEELQSLSKNTDTTNAALSSKSCYTRRATIAHITLTHELSIMSRAKNIQSHASKTPNKSLIFIWFSCLTSLCFGPLGCALVTGTDAVDSTDEPDLGLDMFNPQDRPDLADLSIPDSSPDLTEPDLAQPDAGHPDADMSTGADHGDDMDMPDADMMAMEVDLPEGWLGAQWSARVDLAVEQGWDTDIVLPVRVPGQLSTQQGKDIVVTLNDDTEPLFHETERWVDEVSNVIWVRFPSGIQAGDTLHVYGLSSSSVTTSTAREGDVWRGLARHAYHFDGGDSSLLEYDSVTDDPNHLLLPGANTSYSIPNSMMGYRLNISNMSESLKSQESISPLHIQNEQSTTYEIHLLLQTLHESERTVVLSDENACVGSTLYIGKSLMGFRYRRGLSCDSSTGGQAIIDYSDESTRVYLNTPYVIFITFNWSTTEPSYTLQAHAMSTSAATSKNNTSHSSTIMSYDGSLTIPSLMEAGTWAFAENRVDVTFDTLIVHNHVMSSSERYLRRDALQNNALVFSPGDIQYLSP